MTEKLVMVMHDLIHFLYFPQNHAYEANNRQNSSKHDQMLFPCLICKEPQALCCEPSHQPPHLQS